MIYEFSQGTLWGLRTDVANATPIKFGALQDVSVEFASSTKELYGRNQFPLAVARGTSKISGKAKFASISADTYFSLFFAAGTAAALAGGQTQAVEDEAHLITSGGSIAVSAGTSGYTSDLGVLYASTRLPFTLVSASPAVGEYALSTGTLGTYEFAAGDAGSSALISYLETLSGGQTLTVANPFQGQQPTFSLVLTDTGMVAGQLKATTLKLFAAIGTKLSLDHKSEDWVIPEFDFSCFADTSGNVFEWSFGEVS